jgi:hypothetical protein
MLHLASQIDINLIKKIPVLSYPESSKKPANGLCPEPIEPTSFLHNRLFKEAL